MLVLTRKRYEMIQIGEGIVVKVIKTGRGSVKLGIEAPADVRVIRAELNGVAPARSSQDSVESAETEMALGPVPHAV